MSNRFLLNVVLVACIITIVSAFRFGVLRNPSTSNLTPSDPVAELSYAVETNDLSGKINFDDLKGKYEDEEVDVPLDALKDEKHYVLGANNENKWIEVDLS